MKPWHFVVILLVALSVAAVYLEYRLTCGMYRCDTSS